MRRGGRWSLPGWFRDVPMAAAVGVPVNAAFTGLVTVALPLHLSAQGAGKAEIAGFFVLGALTAAFLVLTVGTVLRNRGVPRRSIAMCATVSSLGLLTIAVDGPSWRIYPAAMAVMAMSLVYPLYVAMASTTPGSSAARTAGALRMLFVSGYLLGLGLFSLAATIEETLSAVVTPVRVALALALFAAVLAGLPRPATADPAETAASGDDGRAAAGRRTLLAVLAVALAVLLLRAADSLRQVYLPLYAVSEDVGRPFVSGLFAITVAVEVLVLVPLSSVSERIGSRTTLLGVCVTGLLSFLMIVVGDGYAILLLSQALYAVFAAGFQSIGMVLLGESLRSGLGAGAGVYTAVVQIGATAGIVAPLAVPGYTSAVFWGAVLFCALAALLLLVEPLLGRLHQNRGHLSDATGPHDGRVDGGTGRTTETHERKES